MERIESDEWTLVLAEPEDPEMIRSATIEEWKKLRAQGMAFAQWSDKDLEGVKTNEQVGKLGTRAGVKCFILWH